MLLGVRWSNSWAIKVTALTRFSSCSWMCAQLRLTLLSPLDCNQPGSSALRFPRQEYWRGLPLPPSGDLLNLGTEPGSRESPSLAGGFFTWSATWEAPPLFIVLFLFPSVSLYVRMYVVFVYVYTHTYMWVNLTANGRYYASLLFTQVLTYVFPMNKNILLHNHSLVIFITTWLKYT